MKKITKENISYYFEKPVEEVYFVKPGELFQVETKDCFEDKIQEKEDFENPQIFDFIINNRCPVTGPIFVEGAKPGDVLKINIDNIELDKQVVTCLGPDFDGPRGYYNENKVFFYNIEDNMIQINKEKSININPTIGTIGVAPEKEIILSFKQGKHGGNLDVPDLNIGTSIYLPVFVEGGLLSIGDLHAIQGDGEITNPLEASGLVTLSVEVQEKHKSMQWPRIESDEYLIVVTVDKSFEAAAVGSYVEFANWLKVDYGWQMQDIFAFLTSVINLRVCTQTCPFTVVSGLLPKKYLN